MSGGRKQLAWVGEMGGMQSTEVHTATTVSLSHAVCTTSQPTPDSSYQEPANGYSKVKDFRTQLRP